MPTTLPSLPETKFRVGDRVRIVGQTHDWGGERPGNIGVVAIVDFWSGSGDNTGYMYYVKTERTQRWMGLAECFRLVQDKAIGKYNSCKLPYLDEEES